ncbi:signal peptidase I [Nocardioides sp. C4-1]|uniref:signal peptidase I n=1 Tax=Nocardioides sp. C4-1 TaxID=3151851 RepID=UPI003267DEE4
MREAVLWLGASTGLVAIAAGIAVAIGGFGFLVFRSGSMSPDIPTGGIALSRTVDAVDIHVGDVVSVTASNGERVTHRVVETTLRGDEATLVLQGDANERPDAELYVVDSAERVVASAPWGGYVVAHLLTPPGLVALGALSLMLFLLTGSRPDEDDELDDDRPDRQRGPRAAPRHRGAAATRGSRRLVVGVAVLAVAASAGTVLARTSGTWASFTDSAAVTTGTFGSATVATPGQPAVITQQTGTGAAPISWTSVGVGGTTAQAYDVVRYAQASGGTGTVVCADVTTTSCTEPKPPTATSVTTYYYAVRAKYAANWTAESATRRPYTPDVVAPGGSINTPVLTTTACGIDQLACGTATDTGGGAVALMEYSLLRQRTAAGQTAYECWNGLSYGAATNNACPTFNQMNGTATWSVPGLRAIAYPPAATGVTQNWTLLIRLTDSFGNSRVAAPFTFNN